MEGGIGQIPVSDDHSPASALEEIPVLKDTNVAGNSSLGITIDTPRNRLLVAVGDVFGNRYGGLAAYDLNSWDRLFLTHLTRPGTLLNLYDWLIFDILYSLFYLRLPFCLFIKNSASNKNKAIKLSLLLNLCELHIVACAAGLVWIKLVRTRFGSWLLID